MSTRCRRVFGAALRCGLVFLTMRGLVLLPAVAGNAGAKPFGEKKFGGINLKLCLLHHQSSRRHSETTAKMGQQKKEANRKERQGKTSDGMGNVKVKGENFYRCVDSAEHLGDVLMDLQIWEEGQGAQAPH